MKGNNGDFGGREGTGEKHLIQQNPKWEEERDGMDEGGPELAD